MADKRPLSVREIKARLAHRREELRGDAPTNSPTELIWAEINMLLDDLNDAMRAETGRRTK